MFSIWRNVLVNSLLVVVSLTVSYLVFSLVTFRVILPHWQLTVRPYFTGTVDLLVQNSKAGYLPQDYIAILGDSNAEGHGDWLLSAKGNRANAFHSAHILHDLTGRDVISLGRGGAGSAQAMVRQPTRVLGAKNCIFFPALEAPKQFLVYFYEGNDLEDNLQVIDRVMAGTSGEVRATVSDYVEERYAANPWYHCMGHFWVTVYKAVKFAIEYRDPPPAVTSAYDKLVTARGIEPGPPLDIPPVDMDATHTELALWLFDYSLASLQRNFPTAIVTMVYLPSGASLYRHAGPWVAAHRGTFSTEQIYISSQQTCEKIRALSLARDVRFIDTRSFLRAAAAERAIHGPRDWIHFNEAGYRVLGEGLARMLDDRASTPCRDWVDSAPDKKSF